MFQSQHKAGSRLKSLAALFLLLAIPSLGLAQSNTESTPPALATETKTKVLEGVKNILQTRAFVPHIDFNKWDEMIAANKRSWIELLQKMTLSGK